MAKKSLAEDFLSGLLKNPLFKQNGNHLETIQRGKATWLVSCRRVHFSEVNNEKP